MNFQLGRSKLKLTISIKRVTDEGYISSYVKQKAAIRRDTMASHSGKPAFVYRQPRQLHCCFICILVVIYQHAFVAYDKRTFTICILRSKNLSTPLTVAIRSEIEICIVLSVAYNAATVLSKTSFRFYAKGTFIYECPTRSARTTVKNQFSGACLGYVARAGMRALDSCRTRSDMERHVRGEDKGGFEPSTAGNRDVAVFARERCGVLP